MTEPAWQVEHNPDFPSIVWCFPTGERELHRLGSRACCCSPDFTPLLIGANVAGQNAAMIDHHRLT